MKRSEMLSVIDGVISTCHPDDFPSSEALLAAIEAAGMEPPTERWVKDKEGSFFGGQWIRMWDPEDV